MDKSLEVVVDAMGGSPIQRGRRLEQPYERAVWATKQFVLSEPHVGVALVGPKSVLETMVKDYSSIRVVDAPVYYEDSGAIVYGPDKPAHENDFDDTPANYTSAHVMFTDESLTDDHILGYVSIGHTKKTLAQAMKHLGRIEAFDGKVTPGICVQVPNGKETRFLMDAGFTDTPGPTKRFLRNLHYWTIMAQAYLSEKKYDRPEAPAARLLSIGEGSEQKGGQIRRQADTYLANTFSTYRGLVEPPDPTKSQGTHGDVILTDGFTGNILIKTMGGTLRSIRSEVRKGMGKNPLAWLSMLGLAGALKDVKHHYDPNNYSGIVLGLNELVSKGHGTTTGKGFLTDIRMIANLGRTPLLARLAIDITANGYRSLQAERFLKT